MAKLNASNERLKRDHLRFLEQARGKSEATLDQVRKALARFEDSTGGKDFKTFRREQAMAFKDRLAETDGVRSGETLSAATRTATLAAVREFFAWLACLPGYKSRIRRDDIEYLTPSRADAARAKADVMRPFPSLEQVRAVIAAMPADTAIERRNRALVAFTILTGIRDRAIASLSLRDIKIDHMPPVVIQNPNTVATKFAKSITTYFFPVGDDFAGIVADWIAELRGLHLFSPTDPLFPCTKVSVGNTGEFGVAGLERRHWADASPIRAIFKDAFERAGLPYYSPHTFRHALGQIGRSGGLTIDEFTAWSRNLGHKNIATTLNTYAKIDAHRQGEILGGIADKEQSDGDLATEMAALISRHARRA